MMPRFSEERIRLECRTPDVGALLRRIAQEEITIHDSQICDAVTVRFTIRSRDFRRLEQLIAQRGDTVKELRRTGLIGKLRRLPHRPVLILGLFMICLLVLYLPTRILFIEVEGNKKIPASQIMEAAEVSGLSFGTIRRQIRSEQLKNQLLETIPQLKWVGVNTYGCRAVITVKERDIYDESQEEKQQVTNITALRDGIILNCTATKGTALCTPGQAVQEGQILISGYTDCGLVTLSGRAEGEVIAATNRSVIAIMPAKIMMRDCTEDKFSRYSLIIGKKQINFFNCSGISGASCVKMKTEYVLTLPGGFSLPLKLMKVTIQNPSTCEQEIGNAKEQLRTFSATYLNSQMISGSVLQKSEVVTESEELFTLTGIYACRENIGFSRGEEIGDFHGKADGTDRQRGQGG